MREINVRHDFLGKRKDPISKGHVFKRLGARNWERFNHEARAGQGQWEKITSDPLLDALEIGYTYGRDYLRSQITEIHD